MRIIQVVTLITPDGAYGGPVRVAINQARALIELGHDVTIVAGHRGFQGDPPAVFDGVPVKLFPAATVVPGAGFAGLYSWRLLRWLKRAVRDVDVVHVHLARDLITLPGARIAIRAAKPTVVQTHGMIDATSNPLAKPLDRFLTAPVMRAAASVFYLTPAERTDLLSLGFGDLALEQLRNGVPIPKDVAPPAESGSEVLFLARLHQRKRPMMFVEMATALAESFPDTRFALVGPDEGEGSKVNRAIQNFVQGVLNWEGPLSPEATNARISKCSIYVLPSVDEPFPMSVLEAMALGKPVVVTDSCGLAPDVLQAGAGRVVDSSLGALVAAVSELLSSDVLRREIGKNARSCAVGRFSVSSVVAQLIDAYSRALTFQSKAS